MLVRLQLGTAFSVQVVGAPSGLGNGGRQCVTVLLRFRFRWQVMALRAGRVVATISASGLRPMAPLPPKQHRGTLQGTLRHKAFVLQRRGRLHLQLARAIAILSWCAAYGAQAVRPQFAAARHIYIYIYIYIYI